MVKLSPVDIVVSQMQQEVVSLPARHTETSVAGFRARLRDGKLTVLRQGRTASFAIPLLPNARGSAPGTRRMVRP